ncbi:hypothetical protein A2U01_0092313, partial [Trifolium medium]|nr:hypothetical protein [Trifolium medium]
DVATVEEAKGGGAHHLCGAIREAVPAPQSLQRQRFPGEASSYDGCRGEVPCLGYGSSCPSRPARPRHSSYYEAARDCSGS